MNHFQKLPHELKINIFDRIEDKAQLTACRLVCKQWDSIAERAIFSKTLEIKGNNESFIVKLYYHLANKPALSLLINSIHISGHYKGRSLLYKKLLQLAMSPSLEQIQGSYFSKDTENLIYQIVLSSPHKFNRIKRIPVQEESNLSRKCQYALRDSLEYMSLSIDGGKSNIVLDHLNEFTKLDCLDLDYSNISDIVELDHTLHRLRNVTKLKLFVHSDWHFMGESNTPKTSYIPKSSNQMTTWLAQNVEKDEGMKSIVEVANTEDEYWPNLVDYLTYKYPNLQFLKIAALYSPIDIDILQATMHIPHLVLDASEFNSADDLWALGYMMKSSSNTVEIRYEVHANCCIDEACRDDSIQMSKFSVCLSQESDHTSISQLLLGVGSGTSKITKASIMLHNWRDSDNPQHMLTLYDILRLVPDVQDLKIFDNPIKYQELGSGEMVLNDLQRMEFSFSKVDHRVITQLGSIAPSLDRLAIKNSLVVGKEGTYAVIMPDSNLSCLILDFSNDWEDEYEIESTEEQAGIDASSIYLYIKAELHPETYYVWRPKDSTLAMTSKEEYDVHAAPKLSAHIECKSLSSLSLKHRSTCLQLPGTQYWTFCECDE
ncbi:hypothetical protein MBANPS3_004930 [Mucor bainieri]